MPKRQKREKRPANAVNGIKPLKQLLGYGSELSNGLSNLAENPNSSQLKRLFGEWLSRCPYAEHICFVDITYFVGQQRSIDKNSITLILTPRTRIRHENDKNYKRVLKRYLTDSNSMAFNPHFARGLAVKKVGSNSEKESGYFSNQIHLLKRPGAARLKPRRPTFIASTTISPPVASETADVNHQWQSWLDQWTEEANACRQLSCAGSQLGTLLAIPVGYRDPKDRSRFTYTSFIFLGFDAYIAEAKLTNATRYILLHLYEADATLEAYKIAEEAVKQDYDSMFAHEIKELIEGIRKDAPAWALDELRRFFRMFALTDREFDRVFRNNFRRRLEELLPRGLCVGETLKSLVENQLTIAEDHKALKEHIASEYKKTDASKNNTSYRNEPEWNSNDYKLAGGYLSLDDITPMKLKAKLFFSIALVSAFTNVLKQSDFSDRTEISWDSSAVKVRNRIFDTEDIIRLVAGRSTPPVVASDRRSLSETSMGTEMVLRGYIRVYAPEQAGVFHFGRDPLDAEFWLTTLPLPSGFLLEQSAS